MTKDGEQISREYSRALEPDSSTIVSNTGGGSFADYSEADLAQLPDDITEQSFGCGNPLAFGEVEPGQVVLDLGCGAGLDLLLAAARVGASGRVIGVDYNADMLALASQRTGSHANIELRQGRIEALPVATHSVDWVISNCVINLAQDKQQAFNEIARVLKPGGRMIVSDIVADRLPWWVRHSGVLRAACGGGVISERDYLDGLSRAGLEHAEILARQYYDPTQLASVVVDAAPKWLGNLRCCGKQILRSLLSKLAEPVAKNLWSARVSASLG